jgi:hypothetical protein
LEREEKPSMKSFGKGRRRAFSNIQINFEKDKEGNDLYMKVKYLVVELNNLRDF